MNDSKCCHSDPNSGARQSTFRESSRTKNDTSSTLQQHSKTRNLSEVGLADFWAFQRTVCRLDDRSSRETTFSKRFMDTLGGMRTPLRAVVPDQQCLGFRGVASCGSPFPRRGHTLEYLDAGCRSRS